MQSTELSKRERRLRAAVVRIEERALEMYPDAGDEKARKWARAKRHAFVAGALFWRYKDQQFAAEGAEMRRQQSEEDKAKNRAVRSGANRPNVETDAANIAASYAGDTEWDRENEDTSLPRTRAGGVMVDNSIEFMTEGRKIFIDGTCSPYLTSEQMHLMRVPDTPTFQQVTRRFGYDPDEEGERANA